MADERQLRDELEKVQVEVRRLRELLENPAGLHPAMRARVDNLKLRAAEQRQRVSEVEQQIAALEPELQQAAQENLVLQAELDGLAGTERALVDATVHGLDPGRRPAMGCTTVLAVMLVLAVVLW